MSGLQMCTQLGKGEIRRLQGPTEIQQNIFLK